MLGAELLRPTIIAFFRNIKKRNRLLLAVLLIGGVLLSGLVYYGLYRFLDYVGRAPMLGPMGPMVGQMLITKFLEMIYMALFFMVFFSSIIAAFSAFYLDDEIRLLFSAPIPAYRIFWSRFMAMLFDSSWMALLFFIPIFFAFATASQSPWWVYPIYPGLIFLYLLMPNIVGAVMALLLASFFPIRQMKKVFQFLSVLILGGMVFFFRFLEPEKLLNPNYFQSISGYILNLRNPFVEYFPSSWMVEISRALFKSDVYGATNYFLAVIGVIFVGILTLQVLSIRYYRDSWQVSMEAVENQVLGLEWIRRALIYPLRFFKSDFQVVAQKEITVFFRDPAIFSQVFMMIAIVFVYGYNLKIIPLKDIPTLYTGEINDSLVYFNGPFIGFILSALAMRFIYPSISLEGRAFWVVKASPIQAARLLMIKFFLYLPALTLVGLVLCAISNSVFKVTSPLLTNISFLNVFLMSFVFTALAIGLGAVYASFNSDNPLKIAGSFGGFVYMIFCSLFIFNLLLCQLYPMYRWYIFRHYRYVEPKGQLLIGLSFLLLIICTIAWTVIPLMKGREAIERYEPE
jgi:ABC-2 type transport system permease protein